MMNRYLCLFFLIFITGCASRFEGNSKEAIQAREDAASTILSSVAPDNCSYNEYKNSYMCDDKSKITPSSESVSITRKKLINHLYKNPDRKDKDGLVYIIFNELYSCRDRNNNLLYPNSNGASIYCKIEIPSVIINEIEKKGSRFRYLWGANGMHKYRYSNR